MNEKNNSNCFVLLRLGKAIVAGMVSCGTAFRKFTRYARGQVRIEKYAVFRFLCNGERIVAVEKKNRRLYRSMDGLVRYLKLSPNGEHVFSALFGSGFAFEKLDKVVQSYLAVHPDNQNQPKLYAVGECFTSEAFRGQGEYTDSLKDILCLIQAESPDAKVFITCSEKNNASRRGIERAGFTLLGYVRRIRLFSIQWIF